VYAYTITGFEQDIGTDGNIAVRLFTTRQDTIYVSASQAILEKVAAGKTIDISKGVTTLRRLLQTTGTSVPGGTTGEVTTTTKVGLASADDMSAYAAVGATFGGVNTTDTSVSNPLAATMSCGDNAKHTADNSAASPACECVSGYNGVTIWDNAKTLWNNTCGPVPQLPHTTCGYWNEEPECTCMYGSYGKITWMPATSNSTGMWMGECTVIPAPENSHLVFNNEKDYIEKFGASMPGMELHKDGWFWQNTYAKCNKGYKAKDLWIENYPDGTEYKGGCEKLECPTSFMDFLDGSPASEVCTCPLGYKGVAAFDGWGWQGDSSCEWLPCPEGSTSEYKYMGAGAKGHMCRCQDWFAEGDIDFEHSSVNITRHPQWDYLMFNFKDAEWTSTCGFYNGALPKELVTMYAGEPGGDKQVYCAPGTFGLTAWTYPKVWDYKMQKYYNVSASTVNASVIAGDQWFAEENDDDDDDDDDGRRRKLLSHEETSRLGLDLNKTWPAILGGGRRGYVHCKPAVCEEKCFPTGKPGQELCAVSTPGLAPGVCSCPAGFKGQIKQHTTHVRFEDEPEMSYNVACDFTPCPAGSMFNNVTKACDCAMPGYKGTVTWNFADQVWEGMCMPVPCPSTTIADDNVNPSGHSEKYEQFCQCYTKPSIDGSVCIPPMPRELAVDWDYDSQTWKNNVACVSIETVVDAFNAKMKAYGAGGP